MTLAPGARYAAPGTAHEAGRGSGRVSVIIRPVSREATGVFPAKAADAAIVCVGLGPEVEGEGYDRGFPFPFPSSS